MQIQMEGSNIHNCIHLRWINLYIKLCTQCFCRYFISNTFQFQLKESTLLPNAKTVGMLIKRSVITTWHKIHAAPLRSQNSEKPDLWYRKVWWNGPSAQYSPSRTQHPPSVINTPDIMTIWWGTQSAVTRFPFASFYLIKLGFNWSVVFDWKLEKVLTGPTTQR